MSRIWLEMMRNEHRGRLFVLDDAMTARTPPTESRTHVPKEHTPPTESRSRFSKKSFSYEDILSATNNFSDENFITKDALGKVYKGKLLWNQDEMNFTVRRLDCTYGLGDELQTEISTLNGLKHKNIISILGLYDDKNLKIIIYEQAFHGTLDQHLSNPNLQWSQRLKICLGVASALNYIHYDIIHCDINSSKIFLNEDWEPKIYGFELSTKYPQSWRHRLLYSHYFNTNNMTPKYDVYSFGVLLLEILCGRKPMITNDVIVEELDEIIDPNLREQMDIESLATFKNIVYNCLNQQLVQRPTMDQIVKQLEDVMELQSKYSNFFSNFVRHIKAPDVGTSSHNLRMDLLKIPLSKIREATSDFDEKYSVGIGGYGIVYKAELDVLDIKYVSSIEGMCKDELPMINKTVAIKRIFNRTGEQGFLTEIELLTNCKHPNIVPLLGFNKEAQEMILVYEYALNGSLSGYLQHDGQTVNLTWAQRIQICLDVAHGINYLHTNMEGKPRIIHRDIKSENILLDENMKAMVADFGLSVSHSVRQQVSSIFTKNIAGTEFYMDPEYLTSSKYKMASDIYSFGVVLFEVMSGRVAYDSVFLSENINGLAPIARRRFNEGTLKELIDPMIKEEDDDHFFTMNRGPNHESFETFSKIAYQCLAETQARRPTMDKIIEELQKALNLQGELMVLSRFQLSDIVSATNNFAEAYCIGLDTNSIVYKAELNHFRNNSSLTKEGKKNGEPSGKHIPVVIKHTTSRGGQEKQEFFEELEIRTSYKHPNIVSLIGFCNEGDELILVYEHVSKRSLEDYLKSANNMDNFTWTCRLRMCLGIACGLNHLHTKMVNRERITHIDIKSADILLDNNRDPKIAYYGISKLHPSNQEVHMKVYEDPEYDTIGDLKSVSDVYSLGVILFEIFCGRLAYDPVYSVKNDKGLAPFARKCFTDGTIDKIIDPKLKEGTGDDILASNRRPNQNSLDAFLEIAYKCLGKAADRPTMGMVIQELERALDFHEGPLKKLQISCKDIDFATENFSERNCVGSGRFWKAYKGELPFPVNGRTTIVAKRWDSKFDQADHQFRTEFNILFKGSHENVIGVIGYCNEIDEKIIVYEHMSKGSLDRYLKDINLTWMKRLEICIDVASGLEFLHQGDLTQKKVIHNRVIRSDRILLNDNWKAKVSNLELASLDSLEQDMKHASDNAYATFGYVDPQHTQGFLTEKSDIYAFGVVLYEILCGRIAWTEDCKDPSQSLGPLAKRCYEEGKLDEIVFDGIKEKIGPESLATFADIAYQCLYDKSEEQPTAHEVLIELKKAFDVQKDHEKWEAQLPEDYKEIIRMSKTPDIYSATKRKDLYDTLSKGILIQEGKVLFSLGSNGERNEMISASQFSYENHSSHKWHSIPESRFDKVAEMSDVSNLNIQIKIRSQFLTSGVNYGVHLVFKFCDERKSTDKRMYLNLTYKMGDETLNAYFATWREDEWMTTELYRFLNHNESDNTTEFEFLLKSFSQCWCGNRAIYVEGVEFRAIDNVKPEENNLMEVQQVNMDPMQQSQTNNIPSGTFRKKPLLQLLSWGNKKKQCYMISAKKALCDPFNADLYNLTRSTSSIFQKVAELLSTQVFRIKCKTEVFCRVEYGCYLVFKLSEQSCELHCPVKVHDLTNNHTKVVYFRSPRPWNIDDVNQVPQEREDGWMEVYVRKFKSNYWYWHQNECTSISLEFTSYEGTMSGLVVRGLELRPI